MSCSNAANDWRERLPQLTGSLLTLRELVPSDAQTLHEVLISRDVSRFISPPPADAAGFERFIQWTRQQREAGHYVCFGVVPHGLHEAVGLFQVRQLDLTFWSAEWGFVLGSAFWSTGVFEEAARLTIAFAFSTLGTYRLEARASAHNGRGNGALQKLGAVPEAVLRRSFERDGVYEEQILWTLMRDEWQARRGADRTPSDPETRLRLVQQALEATRERVRRIAAGLEPPED